MKDFAFLRIWHFASSQKTYNRLEVKRLQADFFICFEGDYTEKIRGVLLTSIIPRDMMYYVKGGIVWIFS